MSCCRLIKFFILSIITFNIGFLTLPQTTHAALNYSKKIAQVVQTPPPIYPICGDGTCQVNEGHSQCPVDCPSDFCGDGICQSQYNENNTTCGPDCSTAGGRGSSGGSGSGPKVLKRLQMK